MPIATLNPATGKMIRKFDPLTESEIATRLNQAHHYFQASHSSFNDPQFSENSKKMHKVAEVLEGEKNQLARLITQEMGKPIDSAVQEIEKCAWNCKFYAENAENFLKDQKIETDGKTQSWVKFQPLGVILAIMPWNFPFWQVFRFAAPALMAGNGVLLKHSSNVPQCALAIEEIFRKGGFHPHSFQTLLISSDQVKSVIQSKTVVAVTLTGSVFAGKQVAALAGENLKKTVLELGGSDPFIVLPSADLKTAVTTGVKARTLNSGQSCIAAKRFFIHKSIADEFEELFVRAMESLKIGDPLEKGIQIGPLATQQILSEVDQQVKKTIQMGAKLLTGGYPIQREGYYYAPTVLSSVPIDSPAFKEEIFGPVAPIIRVSNIDEAIQLANQTEFGLGASAWTQVEHERKKLSKEIQAGTLCINSMVASDPRLPFGGIKNSGYGRELSDFGIREFVNIKTITIQEGPGRPVDSE